MTRITRRKTLTGKNNKDKFLIRLRLVMTMVLLLMGTIIFRLYHLQVIAYDEYKQTANKQHRYRQEISPERGEILIKEKNKKIALAVNRKLMTVIAVPVEIKNPKEVAEEISKILGLETREVLEKISKENDLYEVLKRKLTDKERQELEKMKFPGINLIQESWRYYPAGNLASQVIGFVGYDNNKIAGRYGIEQYFEKNLKGEKGLMEQERDTLGRWISIGNRLLTPERNGQDVVLTLDYIIQFKAQQALKNAVLRHGADSGKIIIIEPESGRILAMTAYPTFDPNNYSEEEDISVFSNPIISGEYECGSVFKPITMAAGLDSGRITPETTYFDTGSVVEAGYEIKNSDEKSYGQQTMTEVIEKSLNTGVIFVERKTGHSVFKRYLNDFGFGEKTGIDLPGEIKGNLSTIKSKRAIEFYTASFGQGITVTPLQLIMAYGAMANGGKLLKPQIIDELIDGSKQSKKNRKVIRRQVITRDTANKLALMLESNVKNGHGKRAGVPGYRVAGKTGTAQMVDRKNGGYLKNATVGSFAGFGPVDNPIFTMLVVIDNPKDVEWAESTAAPLFGELSKFLFEYYNVEPTEEYSKKDLEIFTKTHNYLSEKKELKEKKGEKNKKDKDKDKDKEEN